MCNQANVHHKDEAECYIIMIRQCLIEELCQFRLIWLSLANNFGWLLIELYYKTNCIKKNLILRNLIGYCTCFPIEMFPRYFKLQREFYYKLLWYDNIFNNLIMTCLPFLSSFYTTSTSRNNALLYIKFNVLILKYIVVNI